MECLVAKARFDPCLVAFWSDQKWMIKRAPPHGSVYRIETPPRSKRKPVTAYLVTLRDRETQTVVGYYNGAWTTDRRRALTVRRREAAEAHAAHMRDCCPRNSDVIKVEEIAGRNQRPG